MSHYEISHREREDEEEQYRRDFGVEQLQAEDDRDAILRSGKPGSEEVGK